MKRNDKPASLRSTTAGGRTLIFYDGILELLDIDPATEPMRPKTVTIKRASELTSLSERTINRMIAAGRAEQACSSAA